ncbi:GNAT family N-acetyltransferase [uncultured Vibrio sp.]|uniref:GNAT family N-acetyltransferase n=1 Tax=uncultured Vibrio sp. TaxID=114054 RepID=UPI002637EF09|nr:GNAT family N-acetyltransferase [uncultured Vibrio sp.]
MTIATSRTVLVPYTDQLQHDFIKLNCCPINRAQMNGRYSIASAKHLFQEILQDNVGFCRAIIHNQTRDYLGHLCVSSQGGQHELGFILDKEYWKQGFASEVLKPFFNLVCFEKQLTNVVATVNVGHSPSINLLERLGFVLKETKQDLFGPYLEYRYSADSEVTFYEAVAQTA